MADAPQTGTPDTDVVVVGAGPAGLMLAGELRRGGARVIVLEQLAEPTTESRASTLHARTMEILAERGLLERLGPLPGGPGHFGGLPLDLTAADPGHPYAGQWKCPQTRIEAVLQEWAGALGADVRRGRAVTGLLQHPDRVDVVAAGPGGRPERLSAAYLVGCDGERSTVRQLAGFDFPGRPATREMLRADITGVRIPDRRFERHPAGLATAFRWPDGTTRVMVHRYGRTPRSRTRRPEFAEIAAAWAEVTGEDISGATALWRGVFDDTLRQAARYRLHRVFLAGDAAHVQMPVGGQALNLGLQDSASLGPRLAARITGAAGEPVLDGYHEERHPAGRRALTGIQAQARLLLGGPEVEGLRSLFGELLRLDTVRTHLARGISGLGAPPPATTPSPPAAALTTRDTTRERSDMTRLTGKTALVTGSSRGIGKATALRLAREGALVAVHYAANQDAADETVALIQKEGGRAFPVRAPLGVPGDVHELFLGLEAGLKEHTDGTVLDILVNNAGATSATGNAPEDVTPEDFDHYVAVNAKAPFFIVQRALTLLPDGGRIINISSGLTRFANPEQMAYAMTKGALEQLTLHLARHLAPRRITVNTVAPGITDNGGPVFDIPEAVEQMAQLSAFKRVGEAGDVADVITFLATDEARWITGAFIDATGGTLLG
ncbi:SDR family oxidoreductase [Streptomyces roseirectus]|uniref:SDR family oxidoreductase n=1 Tax=Streptomyces roseirectus TaxID=2768066 RepID=A0A7H0IR25_9ACTN|nr:SDR family oxidoreductase [Streptomyces roseirectus]QNP75241.1 SDR family oxidoreductase [Streptomyces roseirectus]